MKIKIYIPAYFHIINNSVNLEFGINEPFIILQGSNGCGKSTLFHIIAGTKKTNDFPRIVIDDERIYNTIDFKETIRYLPQNAEDALFSRLSVKDNVNLLVDLLNIQEPFDSEIKIKDDNLALWHLSVGQKKVILLNALLQSIPSIDKLNDEPIVVLLDEPFAGLDPKMKNKVFNKIKKISEEYSNSSLKFVIIDHLNIEPIDVAETMEITLRKDITLKAIQAKQIQILNGTI